MKSTLLALLALAACNVAPPPKPDLVERGEYLVATMGCNDCHTPMKLDPGLGMPVPDRTRLLSGHPAGGPEPEGKVGAHDMGLIGPTFTAFARPLLPPMPWLNLRAASDDDLRAIFAYLRSVPAIRNEVPNPKVPDAVIGHMTAAYEKLLKSM